MTTQSSIIPLIQIKVTQQDIETLDLSWCPPSLEQLCLSLFQPRHPVSWFNTISCLKWTLQQSCRNLAGKLIKLPYICRSCISLTSLTKKSGKPNLKPPSKTLMWFYSLPVKEHLLLNKPSKHGMNVPPQHQNHKQVALRIKLRSPHKSSRPLKW